MYKTNSELMAEAKLSLEGKWGLAAGTTFLYMLLINALGLVPILGSLITIVLGGPFYYGMVRFQMALSRDNDAKLEQIFEGFKGNNIANKIITYILMGLFITLWMILLIIPGIMAAYSYALTFYLLAEDPDLEPMEALKKSKELMDGHRMRLFMLHLNFFGWAIACLFTLGIGYFWLAPYIGVSHVKFYDDLTKDSRNNEDSASDKNVFSHLVD